MAVSPVKTPFSKMTFTPDVPSAALSGMEYNIGLNVETDVRGIKKILGEQLILGGVTDEIIFVSANFRQGTNYWFICAGISGQWYGITTSGVTVLTPLATTYIDNLYTVNTVFTASWNGNVLFINDTINPPMYLLPTDTQIRLYDYAYSDQTPNTYVWNYYSPTWTNLTAGFMRVYSSPNLGSLLIAGNLTYTESGISYNLPNTVRWSQGFGINSGPTTWSPTLTNVANELEVPVRGPLIDGFSINGNFYVCSYWDTVVFSPIAYTTTSAPVFGIKLINNGRGLLNENCFAVVDNTVFGLDARDVWVFDGGTFKGIGDQRVKNYLLGQINQNYTNQVFMINNSAKYQIEIYYPDSNSTGYCNKMMSYRYDLDCWNPPRDVTNAVAAVEAPVFTANVPNLARRGVVYAHAVPSGSNQPLIQKDIGNGFLGNTAINSYFRRDNINFDEPYSNNIQVHRVLPEVVGTGNLTITVGGAFSVGNTAVFKPPVVMPIQTDNPWCQINQNDVRVTSLIAGSNDATDTWTLTQANWQITVIEDAR